MGRTWTATALAASLCACATYTVKKSTRVEERVAETRDLPNGTHVSARVISRDAKQLVVAVEETPVCRQAVSGTTRKVKKTERTKRGSQTGNIIGGLLLMGLGVAEVKLGEYLRGEDPDLPEGGYLIEGLGGLTIAFGASGFLPGVTRGLAPATTTTETPAAWQPLSRWDGELRACDGAEPRPVANAPVRIETRFGSTRMTTMALTGPDGTVTVPTAPELVAGRCGDGVLEISTGTHHELADSPEQPDVSRRATAPLAITIEQQSQWRLSWAELAATAGPVELAAARACCVKNHHDEFVDGCTQECARAGRAGRCVEARAACVAKASATDEAKFGVDYCQQLFEDCLEANGTSLWNLTQCTNKCADGKAGGVCG